MMKKLFPILFLCILFFPAFLIRDIPACASQADKQTIKVGFFSFPGYHVIDEYGKRSGYGYDFLQRLARHTDFQYEYIGYDISYTECLTLLERGELDLVTSVSKTPEREKKFLFSQKDIGTNSTIFTVKAGNTKVVKGDYSTYSNLKIGMITGNSKNDVFRAFAENRFEYEEVFFDDQEQLSYALKNQTVDGIVSGSLRAMDEEWLIESLESNPFYLCVNQKRQDLMDQIDKAINEIDLQEPNWRNMLQDKYYSTDKDGKIVINAEEREYLNRLYDSDQKLKVLVNPDRAPYSYLEDGSFKGIIPSLFENMTKSISLPFEYQVVKDRAEYYELRQNGSSDLVLDLSDDFFSAEQDGFKITDPYFSTTHTLIKRKNFQGDIKSVAVPQYSDKIYSDYLAQYLGENISTKFYSSMSEILKAVKSGECDATIVYSYIGELFIWEDQKNEISSELIGESSSRFSIGVNSVREGHLLLSILSKCIASLDSGTSSAIITAEVTKFRPEAESGLLPYLRRNPGYIAIIVAAILIFLFACALLLIRTINQKKLQQKISTATAQLEAQKKELSNALYAADAANRSKTTFLNNMSHDIRTPMNAIIGFTALATMHLENKERVLDYLGKISQASNHLLSLINDVLDMSRIESGKVSIEEHPESLAEILQGLRNIIQSDIHAKHMDLFIETMDISREEVFCDKLRLNQILLNLTSNAIKFTKSGGSVTIRVTQMPSEKEGFGRYEFCVSDTGIGMSEEFLKTVFDPFTRERNSTVSGIQGTGLGMAITKNIVDIMGGTISVKSEQGKGSEFKVTLELRFADSQPQLSSLPELNGTYALVVDDDPVACQSVAKMLRQINMHAEWTLTGREAVMRTSEAIELGHPFEVYIIDWSMPDMDGITTVRQIRSMIGDSSPIILMSAYDWADIEQSAREAGVTDFISKPLFATDLHRTLERILGKHSEKPKAEETDYHFNGKRILLAEDNELNREIAEELLREAGFEVVSAENGKIACDLIKNSAPGDFDLILMDIQMPVMNGYEATKFIRKLENKELASIPIIAMTANAFEEDKADAFSAGMNGHLAKPIQIDTLLTLLKEILGQIE